MARLLRNPLETWSFRKKLYLLTGFAVALALTLSAIGLIGLQWSTDQTQAVRRHQQAASIIAANIAPAMLFGDREAAKENLASVHGVEDIGWIEAVSSKGRHFAIYESVPGAKRNRRAWESVVTYPVKVDEDQIGSLRMGVHYRSLVDIIFANAFVSALICGISLLIVLTLTRWMNAIAYRPIEKLVAAMRTISDSGDYSVRLPADPDPDFSAIGTSFNDMVAQVEDRNAALSETAAALRAARDAAQDANVAKSQFLANMSHELRTPLNAIIGYAEVLREELNHAELTRSLDDIQWIHTSAHQLLAIINSILDLSKIEAGRMDLDIHEFAPSKILDEVLGMLEPIAAQRGNRIQAMIDPSVTNANSDSVKLRQCLLNLGSNACKFTENGQIFILAREEGDELVFTVSDTGIGMAPEELDQLFQPFVQADASTTRIYGGTGLGLTITSRFVQMLGGTVEVESVQNEGSTFNIRIKRDLAGAGKLYRPEPTDAVIQASSPLKLENYMRCEDKPLALIIDDQPSAVKLLSRLAERTGYETVCATDGASGLGLARKHSPDLILLDIGLPLVDGWQVLDELEKDPSLSTIPTVVVTVDDDRRRSLAAGAADHLVKPVDPDEVTDILTQYASGHSGHILVVEDDPATARLYERGLRQMGFSTRIALNGSTANKAIAEEDFCFVITDLRMSEGNGFDLIDRISRMPDWSRPNVIVVTGKVLYEGDSRRLDGKVAKLLAKNGLTPRKLAGVVREIADREQAQTSSNQGYAA